ncbi:MAG: 2-keto-4-pentenoate hydratase [Allosphingosinicella sp.]|uniref:2-keto-4-pentenoate hydratase n=1 Tax=Allosphingosinicella sp. TaxID=2823234 RepID=UPI0039447126
MAEDVEAIAGRFVEARRAARRLDAYPGPLPDTLDDAYAIQDAAIARWNRPVIGWKIGRVGSPLSDRFGVDRLAGPIFHSRPAATDPVAMPVFAGGFAAGEAEFLLRIAAVPPEGKRRYSLDEAADLIDAVHAGIEIASSPLEPINRIGPIAVISDFGNNNGLVVGPEVPDWRNSGFEDWTVTTFIDGEEAGSGRASAFPDGPIGAARFLFELMARRGIALRPGQWISSGAVTGIHPARPGQLVEARFGSDLTLHARLVAAEGE